MELRDQNKADNHKFQLSIKVDIKIQLAGANLKQNTVDNRNLIEKYIQQSQFDKNKLNIAI